MELHIRAVEANGIPIMDNIGKSDPYLKFKVSSSSQTWKTKVVKNTMDPLWNQEFHIPITTNLEDELTVQCYDDDVGKDDLISSMTFKVKEFPVGVVTDTWYTFKGAKGITNPGKIRLVFHLAKSGAKPFVTTK